MRIILLLVLYSLSFPLQSQQPFKIVGYLPTYRFDDIANLEFQYLTHVNLAFINPDANGNLSADGLDIAPALKASRNCKVLASLAGGYLAPDIEANWNQLLLPANRPAFVQKIVQYVLDHGLDGVDIDIEWQYVTDYYSPFVLDLKAALLPHNLLLTAALPGSYRYPEVTDEALAAFDWINMMVYDLHGPWDPSNPGQHSPYWWAQDCIDYWQDQGVPPSRLTLGMPFYGYNFGVNPVTSFTYRTMVSLSPDNAYLDQVGQRYYNGIPTIKAKTGLAMDESLAGVMIWELGQDVLAQSVKQYSLLRAINEVVHDPVSAAPEPALAGTLQLYPNPTQRWLNLPALDNLTVMRADAKTVLSATTFAGGALPVEQLPAGVYFIRGQQEGQWVQARFVKA